MHEGHHGILDSVEQDHDHAHDHNHPHEHGQPEAKKGNNSVQIIAGVIVAALIVIFIVWKFF